jgi:three-Cys-motif partner protein
MNELNIPGKIPKQIRKWTCHKLECFADYIEDYTKTLKNTNCCYLGLYAGCGSCICKGTDCRIEDSELRVLKTKAKFSKYIFVVRDDQDAENLKRLTASHDSDNVEIITGDCNNNKVIRQLFDLIHRSTSSFALIDPTGYRRVRWSTIELLAKHGIDWKGNKIELLIIFPLEMALLRNLARPECQKSITRLYGNQQWEDIKRQKLEGKVELDEVRHSLVELFKTGLRGLGYRYVEDFKPAGLPRQAFYHLILASDRASQVKILNRTWAKTRYLPCELLYSKRKLLTR